MTSLPSMRLATSFRSTRSPSLSSCPPIRISGPDLVLMRGDLPKFVLAHRRHRRMHGRRQAHGEVLAVVGASEAATPIERDAAGRAADAVQAGPGRRKGALLTQVIHGEGHPGR